MKDEKQYQFFRELLRNIPIPEGKPLYVSSGIKCLSNLCKENDISFDPNILIDVLFERVGEDGTLIFPVYNLTSFSNDGFFDYKNTPGCTGALGEVARSRSDFRRTINPMHSMVVGGKDKDLVAELPGTSSFGLDSPFMYLMENDGYQLMINTDYDHGYTFIHWVETRANAPYRFNKTFTGTYVLEDGTETTKSFDYPCRYLDIGTIQRFNRVGGMIEEAGFATHYDIENIPFTLIHIKPSYPIIYKDVAENMASNVYDFENKTREEIYVGYEDPKVYFED